MVEVSSTMWDVSGRLRPEARHRPADVHFEALVPDGWSQAEGWVTVWLPGFLVADRPLSASDGRLRYDLDAASWRREFPNIDPQPVDTFVVTLSATGLDRDGQRRCRARLFVVQGPRIW